MWVVLTLVTAVCTALRDVASKHATLRADPVLVALGVAAVPAVALGLLALARGLEAPGPGFVTALIVSGSVNALATPLIIMAFQRSDLSLVAPVMSLTPIFMIGTGAVVLGELPGPRGMLGVGVIVAGAYLLSSSERHAGPLAPLRALLRDRGARLMLVVAFIYSLSATYDKVGTAASDPIVWAAAIHVVTAVALAPVVVWRQRRWGAPGATPDVDAPALPGPSGMAGVTGAPLPILTAGALTAVAAAAQMTALLLTLAAYVIAVKRTSTLFGVLLGHSVFREERVRERLLGAAVMLAGFVLVTTS